MYLALVSRARALVGGGSSRARSVAASSSVVGGVIDEDDTPHSVDDAAALADDGAKSLGESSNSDSAGGGGHGANSTLSASLAVQCAAASLVLSRTRTDRSCSWLRGIPTKREHTPHYSLVSDVVEKTFVSEGEDAAIEELQRVVRHAGEIHGSAALVAADVVSLLTGAASRERGIWRPAERGGYHRQDARRGVVSRTRLNRMMRLAVERLVTGDLPPPLDAPDERLIASPVGAFLLAYPAAMPVIGHSYYMSVEALHVYTSVIANSTGSIDDRINRFMANPLNELDEVEPDDLFMLRLATVATALVQSGPGSEWRPTETTSASTLPPQEASKQEAPPKGKGKQSPKGKQKQTQEEKVDEATLSHDADVASKGTSQTASLQSVAPQLGEDLPWRCLAVSVALLSAHPVLQRCGVDVTAQCVKLEAAFLSSPVVVFVANAGANQRALHWPALVPHLTDLVDAIDTYFRQGMRFFREYRPAPGLLDTIMSISSVCSACITRLSRDATLASSFPGGARALASVDGALRDVRGNLFPQLLRSLQGAVTFGSGCLVTEGADASLDRQFQAGTLSMSSNDDWSFMPAGRKFLRTVRGSEQATSLFRASALPPLVVPATPDGITDATFDVALKYVAAAFVHSPHFTESSYETMRQLMKVCQTAIEQWALEPLPRENVLSVEADVRRTWDTMVARERRAFQIFARAAFHFFVMSSCDKPTGDDRRSVKALKVAIDLARLLHKKYAGDVSDGAQDIIGGSRGQGSGAAAPATAVGVASLPSGAAALTAAQTAAAVASAAGGRNSPQAKAALFTVTPLSDLALLAEAAVSQVERYRAGSTAGIQVRAEITTEDNIAFFSSALQRASRLPLPSRTRAPLSVFAVVDFGESRRNASLLVDLAGNALAKGLVPTPTTASSSGSSNATGSSSTIADPAILLAGRNASACDRSLTTVTNAAFTSLPQVAAVFLAGCAPKGFNATGLLNPAARTTSIAALRAAIEHAEAVALRVGPSSIAANVSAWAPFVFTCVQALVAFCSCLAPASTTGSAASASSSGSGAALTADRREAYRCVVRLLALMVDCVGMEQLLYVVRSGIVQRLEEARHESAAMMQKLDGVVLPQREILQDVRLSRLLLALLRHAVSHPTLLKEVMQPRTDVHIRTVLRLSSSTLRACFFQASMEEHPTNLECAASRAKVGWQQCKETIMEALMESFPAITSGAVMANKCGMALYGAAEEDALRDAVSAIIIYAASVALPELVANGDRDETLIVFEAITKSTFVSGRDLVVATWWLARSLCAPDHVVTPSAVGPDGELLPPPAPGAPPRVIDMASVNYKWFQSWRRSLIIAIHARTLLRVHGRGILLREGLVSLATHHLQAAQVRIQQELFRGLFGPDPLAATKALLQPAIKEATKDPSSFCAQSLSEAIIIGEKTSAVLTSMYSARTSPAKHALTTAHSLKLQTNPGVIASATSVGTSAKVPRWTTVTESDMGKVEALLRRQFSIERVWIIYAAFRAVRNPTTQPSLSAAIGDADNAGEAGNGSDVAHETWKPEDGNTEPMTPELIDRIRREFQEASSPLTAKEETLLTAAAEAAAASGAIAVSVEGGPTGGISRVRHRRMDNRNSSVIFSLAREVTHRRYGRETPEVATMVSNLFQRCVTGYVIGEEAPQLLAEIERTMAPLPEGAQGHRPAITIKTSGHLDQRDRSAFGALTEADVVLLFRMYRVVRPEGYRGRGRSGSGTPDRSVFDVLVSVLEPVVSLPYIPFRSPPIPATSLVIVSAAFIARMLNDCAQDSSAGSRNLFCSLMRFFLATVVEPLVSLSTRTHSGKADDTEAARALMHAVSMGLVAGIINEEDALSLPPVKPGTTGVFLEYGVHSFKLPPHLVENDNGRLAFASVHEMGEWERSVLVSTMTLLTVVRGFMDLRGGAFTHRINLLGDPAGPPPTETTRYHTNSDADPVTASLFAAFRTALESVLIAELAAPAGAAEVAGEGAAASQSPPASDGNSAAGSTGSVAERKLREKASNAPPVAKDGASPSATRIRGLRQFCIDMARFAILEFTTVSTPADAEAFGVLLDSRTARVSSFLTPAIIAALRDVLPTNDAALEHLADCARRNVAGSSAAELLGACEALQEAQPSLRVLTKMATLGAGAGTGGSTTAHRLDRERAADREAFNGLVDTALGRIVPLLPTFDLRTTLRVAILCGRFHPRSVAFSGNVVVVAQRLAGLYPKLFGVMGLTQGLGHGSSGGGVGSAGGSTSGSAGAASPGAALRHATRSPERIARMRVTSSSTPPPDGMVVSAVDGTLSPAGSGGGAASSTQQNAASADYDAVMSLRPKDSRATTVTELLFPGLPACELRTAELHQLMSHVTTMRVPALRFGARLLLYAVVRECGSTFAPYEVALIGEVIARLEPQCPITGNVQPSSVEAALTISTLSLQAQLLCDNIFDRRNPLVRGPHENSEGCSSTPDVRALDQQGHQRHTYANMSFVKYCEALRRREGELRLQREARFQHERRAARGNASAPTFSLNSGNNGATEGNAGATPTSS